MSREYLREFSKKFEMTGIVYSHAWRKLIPEKNQKSIVREGGALEHRTLGPVTPHQGVGKRSWREVWMDPNGWGGHIKICFKVNFVLIM